MNTDLFYYYFKTIFIFGLNITNLKNIGLNSRPEPYMCHGSPYPYTQKQFFFKIKKLFDQS